MTRCLNHNFKHKLKVDREGKDGPPGKLKRFFRQRVRFHRRVIKGTRDRRLREDQDAA